MLGKHWLKLAYWNMHGIVNVEKSNKLHDEEVLDLFKKNDIICLSELHSGEDKVLEIPEFKNFKLCRGLNTSINRHFGGLAVYYKQQLRPGIKFLPNRTSDFIWLQLCKNFFKLEKDVFICMLYIPPEYSSYYKARNVNILEMIEEDIIKFSNMGHVMLIGDTNARTKDELDFVEDDHKPESLNNLLYQTDSVALKRFSQDKGTICGRGRHLLDLCKSARLRILNGRSLGDSLGSFTCHQWNGSSVVDYIIADEEFLPSIPYFEVGTFLGHISDHCPVSTAIRCDLVRGKVKKDHPLKSKLFPQKYKWQDKSIEMFQKSFTSADVKERVNIVSNTNYELTREGVDEMINNLSNIYLTAANVSLKKNNPPSGRKRNPSKNKKWFSKNLQMMKKEVSDLAKQLQKWPHVPEIRGNFFKMLKAYNKEKRRKSREF